MVLTARNFTFYIPVKLSRFGEFEFESMGAKHRVGIGFSFRPARLHSLAELNPWNQFLGINSWAAPSKFKNSASD